MHKILTIDDNPNVQSLVRRMLESTGKYEVCMARNGREGIRAAKSMEPDLILLDIMMPDIDGFNVLKKLSKNKMTRYIPVVMLTGVDTQDAIEEASREYVDGYILKPVNADKLDEAISRALKYRPVARNQGNYPAYDE